MFVGNIVPIYPGLRNFVDSDLLSTKDSRLLSRMKISVITNISILQFYGYIGYIGDISADILEKNIGKLKIVKNS